MSAIQTALFKDPIFVASVEIAKVYGEMFRQNLGDAVSCVTRVATEKNPQNLAKITLDGVVGCQANALMRGVQATQKAFFVANKQFAKAMQATNT
jgi:hypothetical protein